MKRTAVQGVPGSGRAWSAAIFAIGMSMVASQCYGEQKTDIQALVQETQKTSQDSTKLTLIWWVPEQFWQASLAQNPTVTKAQADQVLKTLRPYTMVAVVDGQIGPFGAMTYRSDESLRPNIALKDGKGTSYAPIAESAVNPDTRNLLQMIKPVIVNMLGPMGQNMDFLLFPATGKNGQPVADPTGDGMLSVVLAGTEFKFRLPLGSLLPPKFDPNTHEKFPGNYIYSPYTGSKLVNDVPGAASQPSP